MDHFAARCWTDSSLKEKVLNLYLFEKRINIELTVFMLPDDNRFYSIYTMLAELNCSYLNDKITLYIQGV